MKLEIDAKEHEKILLEWAEKHWPGQFNTVMEDRYSHVSSVQFSFDKSEVDAEEKS